MTGAGTMDRRGCRKALRLGVVGVVAAFMVGCETPSAHTISRNYNLRGDLPVDPPRLRSQNEDDCAMGGHLFKLYCGSCHNARPLGERPFSNYQVAVAHMRDQAYLTGKEYRQIIMFVRRWDNVGPPTPSVEPSAKRFVYSQPISELRGEPPVPGSGAPPPAGSGPWKQTKPAEGPPTEHPSSGLPAPIE
jgi:hypothetical protein